MTDDRRGPAPLLRRLADVRPDDYLPAGALAIGAGLMVVGVTGYGFLIVSARSLGVGRYASLSALWSLIVIAGPGIFFPLEQEVSRAVAARRARGAGSGPVVRRAAAMGGVLVAALGLTTLAAFRPLVDQLFDGDGLLVVALALSFLGYLGQHLARGVLAGTGNFSTYGAMLAAEGALRLAGCVLLALAGASNAGLFGLALGLAPLVVLPMAWRGRTAAVGPGPPAPWRELSNALGYLLAGSILSQVLMNFGPVAVKVLARPSEQAAAGRFLAALVLARVPLFLFGAVLVALLPKLSQLAADDRIDEFKAALSRLLLVALAVAACATVAAAAAGPLVVRTLFGPEFTLARTDLTVLTMAGGAFMVGLTLAQGLIALVGHREATLGWLTGATVFALVSSFGSHVLPRIERGVLAGSVAAVVTLAVLLERRLRTGKAPVEEPPVVVHAAPLEP